MAAFFPQTKIAEPTKIFGRSSDLRKLEEYAKSLTQIQIIGARRFGKTTVSLCLETLLRNNDVSNIYPLYTDVKTARIKGTANFYRYLIALLTERLFVDGVIKSKIKIGKKNIKSSDYTTIYKELETLPDYGMSDTFITLCTEAANTLNKTILVIFDEYEYMAESTFDSLDGFMPLRDYSTTYLDTGIPPFIFWLVGARTWGSLVEEKRLTNVNIIGGSGEFNNVEIEHYLTPIPKESFLDFWNTRCNEYYSEEVNGDLEGEKEFILSYGLKAFELVSGVPFFGNSVAKYLKTNKTIPDYTVFKSHFDETLRLFNNETLTLLRSLCTPQIAPKNEFYYSLKNYGLITISDDNKCSISMSMLKDYLIAKYKNNEVNSKNEQKQVNEINIQLETLVDSIYDLIDNINDTCLNKGIELVFMPSVEDNRHHKTLLKPCENGEDFGRFVETLSKVYYERTKDFDPQRKMSIPGLRLAKLENGDELKYKNRRFFTILETLRTFCGAHLRDKVERKPYQIEKGDALEILQGHKNEPDTPEAWCNLQYKMLQLFKTELGTIKQKVIKTS